MNILLLILVVYLLSVIICRTTLEMTTQITRTGGTSRFPMTNVRYCLQESKEALLISLIPGINLGAILVTLCDLFNFMYKMYRIGKKSVNNEN